jgi:hypothetical protein
MQCKWEGVLSEEAKKKKVRRERKTDSMQVGGERKAVSVAVR